MAIRAISNLSNRFFPNLGTLSTRQLELRKKVTAAVMTALGATALWCMKTLYEQSQSPSNDISGIAKNVAVGFVCLSSSIGSCAAINYFSEIDLALDPASESLTTLHSKGLIRRVNREILREKFEEILSKRPPAQYGQHITFFQNLSQRYGLKELALQGAVRSDECRYQAFDIDPVSIEANQVDEMFPLRSSLFSEEEWEELSPVLREESRTQEVDYRKFLAVSERYPNRQWDLSVHEGRGWDEQVEARVKQEQQSFAKEIRKC